MNVYKHLHKEYGDTTVKELRDLENCQRKLSRHRNHLVYMLRCRDEGIIPPSLRLKAPINTKNAKDIIDRVLGLGKNTSGEQQSQMLTARQ